MLDCLLELGKEMKIKFESTIDEAIAVQLRLLELSKTARRWKWQGLIFAPLLFLGFYCGIPDEKRVKIVFAAISSVIFISGYLGTYKGILKRRAKKLLIENLGTDKPVTSEYEFNEDGLIFRRLGTEIKFNWNKVREINENDKVLEFIIDNGGIAIIPKRIFENDQQKNEWVRYAQEKTNIPYIGLIMKKKRKIFIVIVSFLIICLLCCGAYYYYACKRFGGQIGKEIAQAIMKPHPMREVNEEGWERLEIGMTKEQVIELLGESPFQNTKSRTNYNEYTKDYEYIEKGVYKLDYWEYNYSYGLLSPSHHPKAYVVYFDENGKVSGFREPIQESGSGDE